jgi:hypothetical protein
MNLTTKDYDNIHRFMGRVYRTPLRRSTKSSYRAYSEIRTGVVLIVDTFDNPVAIVGQESFAVLMGLPPVVVWSDIKGFTEWVPFE